MRSRLFGALGVVAIVAAACSSTGATPSPSASSPAVSAPASAPAASGSQAAGGKQWKIGYSNGGGVGNGFREEQVCTAKAEALASGQVSQLTTIHRNTDAAGQLQDIRDLIAAGVDAIVFNPNDPAALNPALEEAKAAGIKTVAVDQFVTNPDTYQLFNNQVKYAELGAKWLFDHLKGRAPSGISAASPARVPTPIGTPASRTSSRTTRTSPSSRTSRVSRPSGIRRLPRRSRTTSSRAATTTRPRYLDVRHGLETIDAIKASGKKFIPLVGTDRGGFVTKFLDPTNYPGLAGAAVTNTAAVGGAGIALALKLLNGETVQTDPTAAQPNTVLLDPVLADNQTDAGKATLQSWLVDGLDPAWPLSLEIEGYTHYTPQQAIACKGPND